MKPATRLHHAARLERVLAWLAEHPDAEPDLYRLAELACLSPYHFHRVYRGMMGETVAATVQRLRLHRASVALAGGRASLAQVARQAGYASEAAFSRVFGQAFGMPPGRYRAVRASATDRKESDMYPVTIETFPGLALAALPHTGDYQRIGETFDRLYLLAASRGLAGPQSTGIGIYYDDPQQVPAAQLRSAAGVAVAPDTLLEEPLARVDIPETRCAVLEYTGPYSEIEAAYEWLFGTWLPQAGMTPGDFPVFEEYLNDPKTTPPAQLKTKIRLPLG